VKVIDVLSDDEDGEPDEVQLEIVSGPDIGAFYNGWAADLEEPDWDEVETWTDDTIEATLERSIETFGLTDDPQEAGFILENGDMLDFSGKNQGGSPGRRALDHRQIAQVFVGDTPEYTDGMKWFMDKAGLIRMSYSGDLQLDFAGPPTRAQRDLIESIGMQSDGIYWDVSRWFDGEEGEEGRFDVLGDGYTSNDLEEIEDMLTGIRGIYYRPDYEERSWIARALTQIINILRGGPGSGHHGHAGRPGEVGGSAPSTKGATVQTGYGGMKEGFQISTPGGAHTEGYLYGADFPGQAGKPTRGELFYVEVPEGERRKGLGTSLAIDALRQMKEAGAETVNLDPTTESGGALIQSLLDKGVIEGPLQESEKGKGEYAISNLEHGAGQEIESQAVKPPKPLPVEMDRMDSVRSDPKAHHFLEQTINDRLSDLRRSGENVSVSFSAVAGMGEGKGLVFSNEEGAKLRVDLVEGEYGNDPFKISIHGIWADKPGSGLGTAAMYGLREYANEKGKRLEVIAVANNKFFRRFKWFTETDTGNFIYDPPDVVERGGPGSGHHGHEGRPGEVGGSLPRDAMGSLFTEHEKARLPKIEKLIETDQDILTDEQIALWNPETYNRFSFSPDFPRETELAKEVVRRFYQRTGIAPESIHFTDMWKIYVPEMLDAQGETILSPNKEAFIRQYAQQYRERLGGAYLPTKDIIFVNTDKSGLGTDEGDKTLWHEIAHAVDHDFKLSENEVVEPDNRYIQRMVWEYGYDDGDIGAEYVADLITSHVRGPVLVDDDGEIGEKYVFGRGDNQIIFSERDNTNRKTILRNLLLWSVPYMEEQMMEEIVVERAGRGRIKYVMRPEGWVEGLWVEDEIVERGGPGSGHHDHEGRPGEVGGSLPSGQAAAKPTSYEDYVEIYDVRPREGETEREYVYRIYDNAVEMAFAELEGLTPDEILDIEKYDFNLSRLDVELHIDPDAELTGPAFEGLTDDQKHMLRTSYMYGVQNAYDKVLEFAHRRLVARGLVSPDDKRLAFSARRPQGSGEWVPLPETLYHVTTAADAVRDDKLRSRFELNLVATKGLGGGEDDTISFTADLDVARDIDRGLHEASAVARGDFTTEDMVRWAVEGKDAPKPYLGFLYAVLSSRTVSDEEIAEIDARVAADPSDMPENVRKMMDFHIDKGSDPKESWNFYRSIWATSRQHEGGPSYPLFWGVDFEALANADPSQFSILEFTPTEGSMGYQMGALGEWRTVGGDTVELMGSHETLTAEEEEEYFGR
jgi:hypothetical protein